MHSRVLTSLVILLALVGAACGGSDPAPAADRNVDASDGDLEDWERDLAIQRTVLIETAMDDGLTRTQSACMIDTTLAAGEWTLDDLEGIDLSAATSSRAADDLAADLADSLIECGPALNPNLAEDIPGALSIPDTHVAEYDCVVAAYVDAWRAEFIDRYDGGSIDEPTEIDVSDRAVAIIAGCDAGGAVILGASNDGHDDTYALNTLGWECLVNRLEPDQFMAAFPFPEQPGNALERLGDGILADAAYCEEFSEPNTDDD